MADQRISQLTKLAQGDVAANDVLAIVDVGASTTKKVEAKDLFQAGANLADSASIDLIKLNQASATKLGTTALADDAVTAAKLADDSSIAYDSVAPSTNNFEGRGYVNSASKNLQVWDGSAFQQVVAPTAGIGDLQVTTGKLAANAVTTAKVDAAGLAAAALATDSVITAKIQDLAVTTGKLAALSVTTAKIAADAVTADELASNAVVTASIVDANVTEAKLATGSVTEAKIATGAVTVGKIADTQITYAKLNLADGSVPGAKLVSNSVTSAQMAVSSVTTGALTDLNVTTGKLADSAITNAKLANGAITTAKIDAAGLGEAAIATNAITNGKVLDGAITATKLAADSTTIVQAGTPAGSGAYEGQLWFDTNTSVKYVWNGSAWIRQAALNVLNFSDTTPLNFAVAYPDNHTANITTTLDTQDANAVFVGPTSGADAAPTFRALTPADLPNATASTKGIVQPGTGLAVNAGVLNHSNTVTPGTYTRLVVDAQGHISQGQLLEASDIPNLDAAKITTGALPTARLADAAVTIDKLADYSTASIGVEFPTATFTGQLHLNSLDRSFYMWDGNVWVPIGISAGQIVLAGTFDASSPSGVGKVQSVTPAGAAAGFVVNSALPVPTQGNSAHYFVVSEGGTITSGNAPAGALAPPDLLLSVYSTTLPQWVEIDVSAGAGAIAAANVSFVPAGDIAASNVQTAIQEVSTECRNADNITSGTLAVARGGTNVASYTKGDLLAASASTTLTKLPVGTNGQVLRANSATATGLEYGADFVGTVTTVTSSTAALTVATESTTPALTIRAATTSVDGIVQLSDSTGTTSSVLAATPTAVKSAYDLAALALPKAGGTVTGELLIGNAGTLVFEGSTNDGNETTLAVADPTADRTITLPNTTGTVVTTGDTGTVTSTMLLDGTVVDADINANAEIAVSKLADGAARQLLQTDAAGTGVEWASNIDIPGTLDVTSAATFDSTVAVTGALTKSGNNVVTVGDTGTVTSTMLLDGTILNADVNASAGIVASKLSFTQAGTGAVARTVDSKLKDVVSVKDFGAVGDGVADDTAAINTVIAWLNANPGSTVKGSPGTYLVGKLTPITANNTTLSLEGVTLKSKANSLSVLGDTLLTISGNKCSITGLVIDGNQASYAARVASYLFSLQGNGHVLNSVTVINSSYQGLNIGSSAYDTLSNSRFVNCKFDDNSNLGMQAARSSELYFDNCSFNRNGYGFQEDKSNPADFTHDFEAFGFALRFRCHHITFANCVANDNGRDGMNVNQGSYAIKFINCEASRNDDGGFTIAADSTAPGVPGDAEACWDIEYINCEAANNYTSGLVAYQPVHNITVTAGRYYNNNRVAGTLNAADSYISGIFFAAASSSISVDTKAYDERQSRVITGVSGGVLTAPGWVSGTKNYYPKVAIYDTNKVFRGYGTITNESSGSVTITPTTFHGVTLGTIVNGDIVSQRVQHNGVFAGNQCVGIIFADAFGQAKGAPNSDVTGHRILSGAYAAGQNICIKNGFIMDPELLLNPSFDSNITNWTFALTGGGTATHVTTGTVKSAGALQLIGGSSNAIGDASLITNAVKHVSESFIQALIWAYCDQESQAKLQCFWDVGTGPISTTVFHPGGGWERLAIGFFAPSTTTDIIFRIVASAGATTYWDTASMKVVQPGGTPLTIGQPTSRNLPI